MATIAGLPAVLGGRFEIQEALAQGGMATVYRARDRHVEGTAAVKVLAPRLARDPELMERFRGEAQSIRELHHPNIIEVYDCAVDQGIAYIAMRYVPGGTLKDLIQALGGPMDLQTAARIISQVAGALQHAHDHGMIHLDVKPGNVLLGTADWPLLSDFGIIRIAGGKREDGQRVAGTPAYMSPEQWRGGAIDGRSDEYSLGLTFYEIVTGQRPFSGETSAELKAKHESAAPPLPRQLNPGIPGPVEEVMLRAIEKNPEDRFPTIAEFGTALMESVERSRGMQLETKQQIVGAAPNLIALVVLSMVAPLLSGLPSPSLPVFRELTLNWPIALLVALLQVSLLLGVRWPIVGLATRLIGAIIDSLDHFTRVYVRLGTDAQGPLHVARWRNAAVSTAEGLVNVAYLFLIYQLAALPLINTIALAVDSGLFDITATAITGLVLLVAAGIILRIQHDTGPIIAVCVMAICWAFISAMPLMDREIFGGISLQWLIKLVVGLGVLAAFLGVRRRVQRLLRDLLVPVITSQLRTINRGQSPETSAAQRTQIEGLTNGVVNVLYIGISYAIIARPLEQVLSGVIPPVATALLITAGVVAIVVLVINAIRSTSGVVTATVGLVLCTPTLFGLPLFTESIAGVSSFQWLARLILGLGVLILFLGVRGRIQAAVRPVIVPFLARQIGSIRPLSSEQEEEHRLRLLRNSSDAVVDLLYLVAGYFGVVVPVTSALSGIEDLQTITALVYVAFVLAVIYVIYRFVRDLVAPQPRSAIPIAST